jgi:hypothetical protein
MGDISDLEKSITKAIGERRDELCLLGHRGLERELPEKVGQVLYNYYGNGWGLHRVSREMGYDRASVRTIVRRYADYMDEWRKLGGDLAADRVLNLHDIQTTMQDRYADHLAESDVVPSPKDIKEMSIALMNAERAASVARGEATSVVEEKRVTDKDYAETLDAVRKRIELAKTAEVVDID